MNIWKLPLGLGIAVALAGCAANTPKSSRVVYVPMKEWTEPPAAKSHHPEPGGVALPTAPIKLTRHDPIKTRASAKIGDCSKAGVMASCYEEQN